MRYVCFMGLGLSVMMSGVFEKQAAASLTSNCAPTDVSACQCQRYTCRLQQHELCWPPWSGSLSTACLGAPPPLRWLHICRFDSVLQMIVTVLRSHLARSGCRTSGITALKIIEQSLRPPCIVLEQLLQTTITQLQLCKLELLLCDGTLKQLDDVVDLTRPEQTV